MVLACNNAVSAGNAHIFIHLDNFAAPIVTELDWTSADALLAVGAFFFVYVNYQWQRSCLRHSGRTPFSRPVMRHCG
jgi:hypothetical protein